MLGLPFVLSLRNARGTKVGSECETDFLRLKNAVFLGWSGA